MDLSSWCQGSAECDTSTWRRSVQFIMQFLFIDYFHVYASHPLLLMTSVILHHLAAFPSQAQCGLSALPFPFVPFIFHHATLHALIECCVDACYDRDHTIRLKAGGEGGWWFTALRDCSCPALFFSLIQASACNLACLTPAWHRGQSDWQTTRSSSGAPDGQSAPEVCGVRKTWALLAAAHLWLQWAQPLPA